jgi:cytochrome c5
MSQPVARPLLVMARDLQARTDAELVGLWPRAVAFLTRQALEEAVAAVLTARARGAERCSARAQLLCLPTYAPTIAALEATYLWSVLSRACHQHAYELAPTYEELDGWLSRVELLAEGLWNSGRSDDAAV